MSDFFDKLKEGFSKNVAIVSAGSKTVIEKAKINGMTKELEKEKKELIESIGEGVYQYSFANPDTDIPYSEFAELCKRITEINQNIEVNNLKILELENEMERVKSNAYPGPGDIGIECSCGYVNPDGVSYCGKCGKALK